MARGFGATVGAGTTDSLETQFNNHATLRTYSIWININGLGGNNQGRIFEKRVAGAEAEYLRLAASAPASIVYGRDWGGVDSRWSTGDITFNVWHHIAVTYDNSSLTNDPKIYIDGVLQSIAEIVSPTGSLTNNADKYVLGNRKNDNARVFDGMLAEFAIWDRILDDSVILALSKGVTPLSFLQNLQVYIPLHRTIIDYKDNAAIVIVGTASHPHVRTFRPGAIARPYFIPLKLFTRASSTTPTSVLRKQPNLIRTGSITPVGALRKTVTLLFSGLVGPTNTIIKSIRILKTSSTTPVSVLRAGFARLVTLVSSTTPVSTVFSRRLVYTLIQSILTPISAIFTDVTRIPPAYVTGIRRYLVSKLFSERVHRTRYIEDGE